MYSRIIFFIFTLVPTSFAVAQINFGASAADPYLLRRSPIPISGLYAGTIVGNGGEAYGGTFSKVIRVDVFERLQYLFSRDQIPTDHPLYILSDRMSDFEALLDDNKRVYAVSTSEEDVFGDEKLARIVPVGYEISPSGSESPRFSIAISDISYEDSEILIRSADPRIHSISIAESGLSYVRLGADFTDQDGNTYPAGFKFFTSCAELDASSVANNDSFRVRIECNGYRIDGAVASISGFLRKDGDGFENSEIQIALELQSYVIHVDKGRFESLLDAGDEEALQMNVFHEYLRLLGIDDSGYKVSAYVRDFEQDLSISTPWRTDDIVLVREGVRILNTDDQSQWLRESNLLGGVNPITYRARVEAILSKKMRLRRLPFEAEGAEFHVIDVDVDKTVIKITTLDESGIVPRSQYVFAEDLELIQLGPQGD